MTHDVRLNGLNGQFR